MDTFWHQIIHASFEDTLSVWRRPHVYMKPRIFKDGDMWCALLGSDLMEGVAAFGATPDQAAQAWDKVWMQGDGHESAPK